MSYFSDKSVAKRYSRHRPAFHAVVVNAAREFFALEGRLALALDVACGTGQSTGPLLDIVERVVGCDRSIAMLHEAPAGEHVTYAVSSAEALPFTAETFDLISVALAFHWFDRGRFLNEARRVLRPGGRLVIYNNAIFGPMAENSAFESWFRENYLQRYPSPGRNSTPLTEADAEHHGLRLRGLQRYTNQVTFTTPALVAYLTTQSNIIAVLDDTRETLDEIREWLFAETTPLVPAEGGTFLFGGPIWYLDKP
jgi:SAM-dependent methyltransferase